LADGYTFDDQVILAPNNLRINIRQTLKKKGGVKRKNKTQKNNQTNLKSFTEILWLYFFNLRSLIVFFKTRWSHII